MAPVVQKVDNAIHRINLFPVHSAIGFPNTYPLDSDIYPVDSAIQLFEQPRRLPTVPQCLFTITLELDDSQTLCSTYTFGFVERIVVTNKFVEIV